MDNKNEWKKVWDKKEFTSAGHKNLEDLFMQMKIADGYDALGELKLLMQTLKSNLRICSGI